MNDTVSQITLDELGDLWRRTSNQLPWSCPFVTPLWLQTVVQHLGAVGTPRILTVTQNSEVVGVAPLSIRDTSAYFLGIADVCDYQDLIVAPGCEAWVGEHLLAYLSEMGVERLELQALRPDATLCKVLAPLEDKSLVNIQRTTCDVTYEVALPSNWEGYLMQLNGKQRHEVRRKLRRLESYGPFVYRMVSVEDKLDEAVDQFLRLFHLNRSDKAQFMDHAMSAYFRALIRQLHSWGILRLFFLDVDDKPVATVLCFDYQGTRYLYNSGYDAEYQSLSVGILSKILSIRKSIAAGCTGYDFLRGAEVYKKRIGGREVPLSRYVVKF